MRIQRVRVEAFGRLVGYDTGPEPLPAMVVVLGPNEAGKSTLFHCLTTLLYGFRPASRDAHPYVPWGGPDLAAGVTVRLDAGGCIDIERRLLSQPSGRMTLDGRTEDLRNRALPWTEHVPVRVFRQVFALALADLAELDGEAWVRVQDRIVGSMGASDLASARDVAAELEREAGEMWRPNRRGNQRIRDLEEQMRSLRGRRRQALDRDGELRGLVGERERVRAKLHELREARERERLAVERVQELLPVRQQLRRISALREQAGPAEALAGLPADPDRHLEELEERRGALVARLAELEEEAGEPRRVLDRYGDAEAGLASRAELVNDLATRATSATFERARARGLEQEAIDLERRLEAEGDRLLSVPWRDASPDRLAALSTREVRAAVQSFLDADDELRVLREAERRSAGTRPVVSPTVLVAAGVAVTLAGTVLLALGLHGANVPTGLAGLLLAAVGLGLLGGWWRLRAEASGAADGGAGIHDATEARERARGRVVDALHPVPVAASLLEDPSLSLVSSLEALQETLRERGERVRSLAGLRERLDALDAEARDLAAAVGVEGAPEAETTAHVLQRALVGAERARDAATTARHESERIAKEHRRVGLALASVETELEELRRRLGELGDSEVQRGVLRADERLRALRRADELQDEIERMHPSLEELVARISDAEKAGEPWTMDDEDLVHRRARVEELGDDIEAFATRAEALDHDMERLREVETVDAVDGEIATLDEERARLVLDRDRRWVLAALLREADRRFREEHQPDLIRQAGRYLAQLTGGRYDRIVADETTDGSVFLVHGPALPAPVALAHPVSTGTLEQAYLSLRLAIVDHLDRGGERLPLFVDEIFVNWDEARRRQGVETLARVADTRQLFVFTCHDEMAADLSARGARVLELGSG